jgi:hypothetical protein
MRRQLLNITSLVRRQAVALYIPSLLPLTEN